jgi:hypothetical protein
VIITQSVYESFFRKCSVTIVQEYICDDVLLKKNCRFGTIGGLRGDEETDSSEEEGQAFYAGGSERRYEGVILCVWCACVCVCACACV